MPRDVLFADASIPADPDLAPAAPVEEDPDLAVAPPEDPEAAAVAEEQRAAQEAARVPYMLAPSAAAPVERADYLTWGRTEHEDRFDQQLAALASTDIFDRPDERAAISEFARVTGISPEVVRADFPRLKQTFNNANRDPAAWRKANPGEAKLLMDRLPTLAVRYTEDLGAVRKALRLASAQREIQEAYERSEGSDYTLPDAMDEGFGSAISDLFGGRKAQLEKMGVKLPPAMTAEEQAELLKRAATPKEMSGVPSEHLDEPDSLSRDVAVLEEEKVANRLANKAAFAANDYIMTRLGAFKVGEMDDASWELQLAAIEADQEAKAAQKYHGKKGLFLEMASSTQQLAQSMAPGYEKGGTWALAAGGLAGVGALALTRGNAKAAWKTAKAVGQPFLKGGIAVASFQLESGSFYNDSAGITTDDGKPLSEETRIAGSLIYGTIASAIESANEFGPGARAWGPVGDMVKFGDHMSFMKSLLMEQSGKALLARVAGRLSKGFAKRTVDGIAGEVLEEMGQQFAQDATGYAARSATAGELQKPDIAGSIETQLETAWTTGLGSLGIVGAKGAAGHTVSATKYAGQKIALQMNLESDSALGAKQRVDGLQKLAKTLTAQADPEYAAKYVEMKTAQDGDPVTHVYPDATSFVKYNQLQGLDVDAEATRLLGPEGPQQLRDALESGMPLEVPVQKYVETWGKDPIAKALSEDTATHPLHMTPREMGVLEPTVNELAKEIEEKNLPAESEAEKRLVDAVEDQLVATGRMNEDQAKKSLSLKRAFIRTMSQAFGKSADDLFDFARADVSYQQLESMVNKKMAAQGDESATAAKASQEMAAKWDDPKFDRATEFFIDKNTGVKNERALMRAKPREGQRFVTQFSVEGVKWLNDDLDAGGHEKGDALYAAVARVLHELKLDVYKAGGDFAAFTGSKKEAQALARQATKALDALGVKGFQITSQSARFKGDTVAAYREAGSAHARRKGVLEKKGKRSTRGAQPLGVKQTVAELSIPAGAVTGAAISSELRDTLSTMTPAEAFQETYVTSIGGHDLGILSEDGYRAQPKKAFRASIDLDGLKAFNTLLGDSVGDQILAALAAFGRDLAGDQFDFARLHGDEFAAQFETEQELRSFLEELRQKTDNVMLVVDDDKGRPVIIHGLGFSYGIGENDVAAEKGLRVDKADRKDAQKRGDDAYLRRLEFPRSEEEVAAATARRQGEAGQGAGDVLQRDRDLEAGRVNRVARPQAHPSLAGRKGLSPEAKQLAERVVKSLQSPNGPASSAEVALPPPAGALLQIERDAEGRPVRDEDGNYFPEWKKKTVKWMQKNGYSATEIRAHLAAINGQMKIFAALGPAQVEMLPRGATQQGLTNEPKGPIRANVDPIYKITFDASAMCVKRLEAAETQAYIQQKLGRPLSASERIALVALFKEAGEVAPCLYCYVESPRAKAGEFAKAALDVITSGKIPEHWGEDAVKAAKAAITEYKEKKLEPSSIDPNLLTDPAKRASKAGQKTITLMPKIYDLLDQQTNYAKANKPKLYEEYGGQILSVPDDQIAELNGYAGFRFFSTSDFQAEHTIDLIQAFRDLTLRKAKAHSYTKVVNFVEIFGGTGMKIQTSLFAQPAGKIRQAKDGSWEVSDEAGVVLFKAAKEDAAREWLNDYAPASGFAEDTWQGMGWKDAQRLSKKFKNVGAVFVATSDAQVRWALDQPWIHYVIPFHYSGLEGKYYKTMGWSDFTSTQSEKAVKGLVRERGGKFEVVFWGKVVGAYERRSEADAARKEYLAKQKVPAKEDIAKIRMHELGAGKGASNEDMSRRYLKLARERGIEPVFAQFSDHPSYAKLKKDYARSDTSFDPVNADKIDMGQVERVLAQVWSRQTPAAKLKAGVGNRKIGDKLVKLLRDGAEDVGAIALAALEAKQDIAEAVRKSNADPRAREEREQHFQRLYQPAYHGTPHRGIQKFSLDKIGTGEGAQSYGYGLYFAGNKKVAESYRKNLSKTEVRINGKTASDFPDGSTGYDVRRAIDVGIENGEKPEQALADAIRFAEDESKALQYRISQLGSAIFIEDRIELKYEIEALAAVLKDLKSAKVEDLVVSKGQLYKVDVPEDDQLLDYDKSLDEQPAAVVEKLKAADLWPKTEVRETPDGRYAALTAIGESVLHRTEGPNRSVVEGRESAWAAGLVKGTGGGNRLYRELASAIGPAEASAALNKAGVPGLRYLDGNSRRRGQGNHNYVVWNEEAIKILDTFYEGNDGDIPRGWLEIEKSANKRMYHTVLTQKANLSTFLHEGSHEFLDMMLVLAERPDAPERLKKDLAATIAWLGVKDAAALRDSDGGIKSEYQEKWARTFEQYLRLGEAPSIELRDAFHTFSTWLKKIYKSVVKLLDQGASLDPSISGVFDRLLATDEEITRMRESAGLKGMFRSAEEAGMTPEQWDAYLETQARASDRAGQAARKQILREEHEKTTQEWQDKLGQATEEAEKAYEQLPARRAQVFLKTGQLVGEDGTVLEHVEGLKLNRGDVARLAGDKGVVGLAEVLSDKGVNPEELAPLLKFKDGQAMLEGVLTLQDKASWVRRAAAEAMDPKLLEHKRDLEKQLEEGWHSEFTEKQLLVELDALGAKSNQHPTGKTGVEAAREAAYRISRARTVRQLDPTAVLRAERTAASKALVAATKGNYTQAYVHKQQQLLNHYLYNEVNRLRKKLDAAQKYLTTRTDAHREALGKAHPALLLLNDGLLDAAGLEPHDVKVNEVLDALEQSAQIIFDTGEEAEFDASVLREVLTGGKEWKDLTVKQALELRDAVKELRTFAGSVNEVVFEGQKVAVEQLVAKIEEDAAKLPFLGKSAADEALADTVGSGVKKKLAGWDAVLLDPESLFNFLGKTAHDFFFGRYLAAQKRKRELTKKVLSLYQGLWEQLPKAMQEARYDVVPGLEQSLPIPADINKENGPRSREWLWMVALNTGNKSNLERLLGGFKWTEEQVMEVLRANLTKEEWDWVQGVWDVSDKELWPLVAEKEERKKGVSPEKIKASYITTPHGVYRGGYFPAIYDPSAARGTVAARQADALGGISDFYGKNYVRAATQKSHTQARAESYDNVLRLSWSVVPSHIAQVIHDIAFDETVRDLARVLTHQSIKNTVNQRLGEERAKQLPAWLAVVANAQADAIPAHMMEAAGTMSWLKSAAVTGSIGWSFTVALGDFSNPFTAMASGKIGLRHGITALGSTLLPGSHRFALERSEVLSERRDSMAQKLREFIGDIGKQGRKGKVSKSLEAVRSTAWFFMEQTDKLFSTHVWLAAYRDAMSKDPKNEAAAIKHADEMVRTTMPSHEAAEQSAILRDKRGFGGLLMFHGYFNKLYNIERGIAHDARQAVHTKGWGASGHVAMAAGKTLAVLFFANVMGEVLSNRGPDEEEEWGDYLARKMIAAPFGLVPFGSMLGEPLSMAITGKQRRVSARVSPGLSVVQQLSELLGKLASENREDDRKVFDVLEMLLFGLKLQARQSRKTLEAAWRLFDEQESLSDNPGGLLFGPKR